MAVAAPLPPSRLPAGTRLPRHIAIIMDGNGRWARLRKRPRTVGHRAGARAVRTAIEFCLREGIGVLTLFAFSSENWSRPEGEVRTLLDLFLRALNRDVKRLAQNGVRLRFIGERDAFAPELRQRMADAEARTASNHALQLVIAVNYGGRWDIAQACRALARRVAAGEIEASAIDEAAIGAHLSTADLPEPDLFIRTGGEIRISNFLLWQLAYTECWFSERLWPDLDDATLCHAVLDYAARERRFGGVSDQATVAPQA
ncbi:MAG TPA: polyprenyl diphosphate synthase [Xanthomonadaceae bacterium]|nr:polyprenyl diphosphate synthase [Xanthomonadaceae bacterium]